MDLVQNLVESHILYFLFHFLYYLFLYKKFYFPKIF